MKQALTSHVWEQNKDDIFYDAFVMADWWTSALSSSRL